MTKFVVMAVYDWITPPKVVGKISVLILAFGFLNFFIFLHITFYIIYNHTVLSTSLDGVKVLKEFI